MGTTLVDQSDIDAIRRATDLVRLIGEHVSLKPKGREHIGLCPFHDDSSPSMCVVTHKGDAFYKCFACGASGNCFQFVMQYHQMEFPEAVRYLADRAGITIETRQASPTDDGTPQGPRRRDLLAANEFAAAFFRDALASPEGEVARAALEARGITPNDQEAFGLGYSPAGPDALLKRLRGKSSAIRTAVAAGLLQERDGGAPVDRFRHRIMFPIRDDAGRPIAFGARAIDPDAKPKYLNSAESRVFHKSRTLYGLDLARRPIIEAKQAIVTEGYTDVIACHRAGFANTVATLGTAMTSDHATMLGRLCDTVILLFDGDAAGQRAADRAIEVFLGAPVDVRLCVLPGGADPDDLLRQPEGAAAFRTAIDEARDAIAFKLERFDGIAASGTSARQKAIEQLLEDLAALGLGRVAGVRRAVILDQIAGHVGLPTHVVESQLNALAGRRTAPPNLRPVEPVEEAPPEEGFDAPVEPTTRARRIAEREVAGILVFAPQAALELAAEERPVAGDFSDPALRAIAEVLDAWLATEDRGPLGMTEWLARLPGPAAETATTLFIKLRERLGEDDDAAPRLLNEALTTLRACVGREAHAEAVDSWRRSGGTSDTEAALRLIEERRTHGHLPAAIPRGVRSPELSRT